MPQFAFKEWAVVCRALAEGRQAMILRKGGIAEDGGTFRPEHSRFWLLPTYLHQDAAGLKPEAAAWLEQSSSERPPTGILRLTHFAEVPAAWRIGRLDLALDLAPWHVWSEQTVRQRFAYREPGLFVLPVRVYRAQTLLAVPDRPEYAGCKTWVDLGSASAVAGTPVLADRAFAEVLEAIYHVVHPVVQV